MKQFSRFAGFVGRFWGLWLPLLLVFALPLSRPTARIITDPLVLSARRWLDPQTRPNAMPDAANYPRDFDLQVWHLLHTQRDYSSQIENDARASEVARLRSRFPREKVLVAEPLLFELGVWRERYWFFAPPIGKPAPAQLAAELKPLYAAARQGARMEPNNAFWWAALAHIEWRANRYSASLVALERAAKCPYYDDFTLELARRGLRAQSRFGAPLLDDKRRLLSLARDYDTARQIASASAWGQFAKRLSAKGTKSDLARALRWSGALGAVGDLMQRDPNALATLQAGASWQNSAYRAAYPAGVKQASARQARVYFVAFATRNGRPDLARAATSHAARAREVERLTTIFNRSTIYNETWSAPGDLGRRLEWVQALALGSASCLFYLALWWLMANLLLWRGRGAPSSRRDRYGLALGFAVPALALTGLGIWALLSARPGPTSPRMMAYISALCFAFAGAPWVCALACALLTMRRHSARFALPPRVDMELSLSNWSRGFLRWFLPLTVACSALVFVGGWILWLVAFWRGWSNVDLLALLPPDRNGFTGSMTWNPTDEPAPLIYGIFLCALCLSLWFAKWRWTAPRDLRPLTHGALRWWKETLGALMVTLAWFALLASLVCWPLVHQTEARLTRVLQNGELSVIRESQIPGATPR